MDERLHDLRQRLSHWVFDTPHTRSSTGKLVESMLHRALTIKSIDAQQAFSVHGVEHHLMFFGKAEAFDLESHQPDQRRSRPLYLQPQSSTLGFVAVDAILITGFEAFFIQSAMDTDDTHNFLTLLHIVHRLQAIDIEMDFPPLQLVYCLLGTAVDRVTGVVEAARTRLAALRTQPRSKEVAVLSQKAVERLSRLRVQGVVFDTRYNTLTAV
ncbi:hypothetical protein C8R44DRAFT_764940 [Mycena epipterygia]|nr:hypothetical protein C8R44DRAFT_764940 [Mycena epipterygia]